MHRTTTTKEQAKAAAHRLLGRMRAHDPGAKLAAAYEAIAALHGHPDWDTMSAALRGGGASDVAGGGNEPPRPGNEGPSPGPIAHWTQPALAAAMAGRRVLAIGPSGTGKSTMLVMPLVRGFQGTVRAIVEWPRQQHDTSDPRGGSDVSWSGGQGDGPIPLPDYKPAWPTLARALAAASSTDGPDEGWTAIGMDDARDMTTRAAWSGWRVFHSELARLAEGEATGPDTRGTALRRMAAEAAIEPLRTAATQGLLGAGANADEMPRRHVTCMGEGAGNRLAASLAVECAMTQGDAPRVVVVDGLGRLRPCLPAILLVMAEGRQHATSILATCQHRAMLPEGMAGSFDHVFECPPPGRGT